MAERSVKTVTGGALKTTASTALASLAPRMLRAAASSDSIWGTVVAAAALSANFAATRASDLNAVLINASPAPATSHDDAIGESISAHANVRRSATTVATGALARSAIAAVASTVETARTASGPVVAG
jgi:hypothetical protein